MQTTQVVEYARQLLDAHGDEAVVEASRRIRQAEELGDTAQVSSWKRIRSALQELRPPHVS